MSQLESKVVEGDIVSSPTVIYKTPGRYSVKESYSKSITVPRVILIISMRIVTPHRQWRVLYPVFDRKKPVLV